MLEESGCVLFDRGAGEVNFDLGKKALEGERRALMTTTLGEAASKYYLDYKTPKQFRDGIRSISGAIRDEGISQEQAIARVLEVVAFSHEFDELPVRHNEENENGELCEDCKWGILDTMEMDDPHTKAFLLMQVSEANDGSD